ncbi:MAG: hypothetical protein JO077_02910 [Verrucomicrobia bacterium]|nr:hypothetical protein [Verrucomicrobiota bacterium]
MIRWRTGTLAVRLIEIGAVLLLTLVVRTVLGDKIDPRKPYGRVCLSVVTGSRSEAAFDAKAAYDGDDRLIIHLDTTEPCTAVTLALDPTNGHLANGWRPQAVDLSEQDVVLPQKPVVWSLASTQEFDFYVLFLDSGSSDAREIKGLVKAMETSKSDSQLLSVQTTKLHELLTRQLAGTEMSSHSAAIPLPEQLGGALRGSDEFPWRRFSVRVNFSQAQVGMLIFSRRSLESKQ